MQIKSSGLWKALLSEVVALSAPVVCLFYRKGWYLTPDDTESPFGRYEPAMQSIYQRFGKRFGDWWWLGVRNRAYGFAYAMKPDHFKRLTTYANCQVSLYPGRFYRKIIVDGYVERMFSFGFFHVIVGYRLRPVFDEWQRHWHSSYVDQRPAYRPINMDARPILSIRGGGKDD